MNANFAQARDYILRARESLRRGDKATARMLGEQAALLAPEMEDAWLILAASDPNPEDALAYALKAREINPQSTRARRGVDWAEGVVMSARQGVSKERLNQARAVMAGVDDRREGRNEAPKPHIQSIPVPILRPLRSEVQQVELKSNRPVWMYGSTIGLLICIVLAFAAWSAVNNPALADLMDSAPAPTQEKLWAQVEFAKPSVTPIDANAFAQAVDTPEPNQLVPETGEEPQESTSTPVTTDAPTLVPAATETPAVLAMDIVVDTPTSKYIAPTKAPGAPPVASGSTGTGGVRWIDVDLTNQMVYAYEGDTIVNSFVVSTGTWMTPTVTGKYKIWIKLKKTNMSGPGYYLADVPYVMYFHKGYGLHGTYWHNNFGTPMSHGCVNLSISDAEWLYNWAFEGTVVNVHY